MTWARIPLKHLAVLNPETLGEDTDPGHSFRYIDIATTGRGTLVDHPQAMTFETAPSRARRVLRPGDTILSTVRTYLRAVWTLRGRDADLIASTGFVCLRPRAGVDSRFLGWLVQADTVVEEVVARSVGVSYPAVNPSEVGLIKVLRPPLTDQQAIADYLDLETERLDSLVRAKRRMAELLEERWQGVLEATIQALGRRYGETRLKYVCREVVVGIVITPSAWYAESGVPAIRGVNVSPGAISLNDLVYLTPEGHALHPKSHLRSGDVVVVRTGQAGAAAVVPPELEGANCIDLVIIRLSRSYSPQFVEYVLNSDWMQKHIDEHSVGTIQSHFNVGAASVVPVPRAPVVDQHRTVEALREERGQVSGMIDVLNRQIALLQEHRHALITAAVTGQLDIPAAA